MKKWTSVMLLVAMAVLLLTGCGDSKSAEGGKSEFNVNVYVNDESGKPVAGVKVQACDDSVCMLGNTDASGHAGFTISKNTVDVHLLKVPEGFTADPDEVFKTDDNGNVTITVKAN